MRIQQSPPAVALGLESPASRPAQGKPSSQGSVLVITVILCLILGILMGSYLWLVRGQQLSVARSQRWHNAMVVAEAGVDEAMALLNSGIIVSNYTSSPYWSVNSNSITKTANYINKVKQQFGGSYYTVVINKSNPANPVITATGFVPVSLSTQLVSRGVQVITKPRPAFPIKAPMIVVDSFTANGFNIRADGFSSTNLAFFPGGVWNPTNATAEGDIVTLSTNAGSVHIGNAKVKGDVRTPPGGIQGVTATIGAQGSVGDSTWVNNGNAGIQPGHFKDDVIFTFDPVVLPNVTWSSPVLASYTVNGTNYNYLLSASQPNRISGNLTAGQTIYVNSPNTILYVTGNVAINTEQVIMGPGASLTMYVGGSTTSIAGNGIVNGSGLAKNFIYYGLPTNTDINFNGNASFIGCIYAPNADFHLGGGGSDVYDFSGACITKTTVMNGHFNFHYDDALQWFVTLNGYSAISWTEM